MELACGPSATDLGSPLQALTHAACPALRSMITDLGSRLWALTHAA